MVAEACEDCVRDVHYQHIGLAYKAIKKMRELKHTRSISKYVDEFSKLMLQIDNMNSNDLLFNFLKRLQLWA